MSVCRILLFFLVLVSGYGYAEEPDACRSLDYDHRQHNRSELIHIAQQCQTPAMRTLYFNRAQHLKLLQAFRTYNQMTIWPGQGIHYERHQAMAYQGFVQMLEAFAGIQPAAYFESTVAQLNRTYKQTAEVAELRLRGNHRRADWLEANVGYGRDTQ